MTRRLIILCVAFALATTSAALAATPRLTVLSRDTFAVHGVSFHPREHVLIVVTTSKGTHATKRLEAGAAGTFTARFAMVALVSCEGYVVQASGDKGSHALLKVRPPECPAPITP